LTSRHRTANALTEHHTKTTYTDTNWIFQGTSEYVFIHKHYVLFAWATIWRRIFFVKRGNICFVKTTHWFYVSTFFCWKLTSSWTTASTFNVYITWLFDNYIASYYVHMSIIPFYWWCNHQNTWHFMFCRSTPTLVHINHLKHTSTCTYARHRNFAPICAEIIGCV
jgi:hypothetical protein